MNLQDGVSLLEGLLVTLFSMGIVLLTLLIISFILWGFKLVFYKESRPIDDNNEELIAVISAAIEAHNEENKVAAIVGAVTAYNESEGISLNIKNIRKIS